MKLPLLALLCAGTAAFCQSPAQPTIDPDKLFQMPDKFTHPALDFSKLKQLPAMKSDFILVHPRVVLPPPRLNNPQIDPKIIVRPPWPREGEASRGQDVSRNLYPSLRFLPLNGNAQHGK
jgi:hypothetical protein